MLANQYFIVNRFQDACTEFEEILDANPSNSIAKKKLVLCYIHIEEIQSAFKLFAELVTTNINILTENEISIYDKPCKKMISYLKTNPQKLVEKNKLLILGMLWTYCDINNAKIEFEKLNKILPNDPKIITILTIINHLISQNYKEKENGTKTLLS